MNKRLDWVNLEPLEPLMLPSLAERVGVEPVRLLKKIRLAAMPED